MYKIYDYVYVFVQRHIYFAANKKDVSFKINDKRVRTTQVADLSKTSLLPFNIYIQRERELGILHAYIYICIYYIYTFVIIYL